MKFEHELKYDKEKGTCDFYNLGTITDAGIKCTILIVNGKFFDNHQKHSVDFGMPTYGSAFRKDHPDYKDFFGDQFNNTDLIILRDEMYQIASEEEINAVLQHEFGHIFFGHQGEIISKFQYEEILADCFVEKPEYTKSLEKKWAFYNLKKCTKCKNEMIQDETTIPDHWMIYCKNCGEVFSDGELNHHFVINFVRKQCGKIYDPLFETKFNPILSLAENIECDKIITENRLLRGYKKGDK